MIERYTRPAMGKIWTDKNKYKIWLEIEVLAVEARYNMGEVPKSDYEAIKKKARIDVARILEIEEKTKHDVIAFLTNVEELVGEPANHIHIGMTSSDVLDTCLAVQTMQSGELILKGLNDLKEVLAKRAIEFKNTVCIGRSHGIHAEAMTFGLKFALWYDECNRNIDRFTKALNNMSYGMISGAVGTYEHISPTVESYVCEKLGLNASPITTQVISRDRHAEYMLALALIGSFLEKIATEVRHLQRTEVQEAEEYFAEGQKGSSAMPHKRNPIASENICGQARLLRSNALAAIENNALWHERDISHSSVERVIFPDSNIIADYIIQRSIKLLDSLIVYPENMLKNLNMTHGLIHSQKIMLFLAKKGMPRQKAYEMVQSAAMKAWIEKRDFRSTLLENNELMTHIKPEEIDKLFTYKEIFKSTDKILKKLKILK